jgi:hypothetical protein
MDAKGNAMIPKKYRLNDGKIYWHKLWFALAPKWMTRYSPPGGSYNYAAYAYKPHEYVRDLYLRAKWFIQRGYRGYADCDIWGWCNYHATIMVGVLKYLREHKNGYPIGLTPGKWSKKLDVMEQGFQSMIDEENDVTSYKRLSRKEHRKLIFSRRRKMMLGLKYFRTYYYDLWD